jgi:hypothetical protein
MRCVYLESDKDWANAGAKIVDSVSDQEKQLKFYQKFDLELQIQQIVDNRRKLHALPKGKSDKNRTVSYWPKGSQFHTRVVKLYHFKLKFRPIIRA